jgi:hypothetical protein
VPAPCSDAPALRRRRSVWLRSLMDAQPGDQLSVAPSRQAMCRVVQQAWSRACSRLFHLRVSNQTKSCQYEHGTRLRHMPCEGSGVGASLQVRRTAAVGRRAPVCFVKFPGEQYEPPII